MAVKLRTNLRALLRLYRLYAKMNLKWFLSDRATCCIVLISETISNIAGVAGILLLAARFGGVGGLTADEILFMLGFYEMGDGVLYIFHAGNNCSHISRRVGRGQVDHMLIQPRPLLMQLMAEGFIPVTGSGGLIMGLIITVTACVRLHMAVDVIWLGAFALYIACHVALKMGQSYLYGALAFWWPVACEEISSLVLDMNMLLGKYPLAGLPAWLIAALSTVLPCALMAYVPALILLGKLSRPAALALPVAVATAFLAVATYLFRKGLRHYAQYSCNRYRSMGHR